MAHRWTNTLTHDDVTPHSVYLNRRAMMAGLAAGVGLAGVGSAVQAQEALEPNAWEDITQYNNYYEFGTGKTDPAANALPAAVLVASFVGTGASFLAFAGQADRRGIARVQFAYKGLTYLDGLAEGTETIVAFALMCLFPQHFALIAWAFAALCAVTAINRVVSGYRTLTAQASECGGRR